MFVERFHNSSTPKQHRICPNDNSNKKIKASHRGRSTAGQPVAGRGPAGQATARTHPTHLAGHQWLGWRGPWPPQRPPSRPRAAHRPGTGPPAAGRAGPHPKAAAGGGGLVRLDGTLSSATASTGPQTQRAALGRRSTPGRAPRRSRGRPGGRGRAFVGLGGVTC